MQTRTTRLALLFPATVLAAAGLTMAACGGSGGGASTSTAAATTAAAAALGDAVAGAKVYSDTGCGSCHTLAAAGSTGTIGPNLDDLKPDFESVVAQVTAGGGAMPSFKDQLSAKQIRDVAAYVVQSSSH
jgi:mono/diheme cytochrome c family protein